jgi:iron(III) transport system ATP-binding protein
MHVSINNLTLSYGTFTAVRDFELEIEDGESIVLLGQSGCGKTSTMRCVAGLEVPDTGRIRIGDSDVFNSENSTNVPPNKRNIGMVFQSYAVWPHLTVLENVSFPLKMRGVDRVTTKRKALETLEIVGLAHLADKGASLLSGGQMQRVALARSLAMEPNVMLLDEPLSNLDARLRDDLRLELRRLQLELGLTSIYVTHDQSEALALADRIAIMQNGRIAQLATPVETYRSPASASIARFLGVSNVFPVKRPKTGAHLVALADFPMAITVATALRALDEQSVCLRPESLTIAASEDANARNQWPGTIQIVAFQGSYLRCTVQIDNGPVVEVLSREESVETLHHGDRVWLTADPEGIQVLSNDVLIEE